jgi:hypothetical protein
MINRLNEGRECICDDTILIYWPKCGKLEGECAYVNPLTYYNCDFWCISNHTGTLLQRVIEIMSIRSSVFHLIVIKFVKRKVQKDLLDGYKFREKAVI